jgi:hypothetical protein
MTLNIAPIIVLRTDKAYLGAFEFFSIHFGAGFGVMIGEETRI